MRKRMIVIMLITTCLLFGGCERKSTIPDNAYNSSYKSEDISSDEGVNTETNVDKPTEVSGIIAMVRKTTLSASGGHTDIQVISIDPETGTQSAVSKFRLNHITYAELRRAEEIDNETEFYYEQPETLSIYGNNRDWFSDDFTKVKANRTYVNSSECHAGWVDSNGVFFDVTEAIDAVKESSFSDPGPVAQRARGFDNGRFVFSEIDKTKKGQVDNTRKYCVPLDNISADTLYEADKDDVYNNGGFSPIGCPTDRIDENTYIMDKYNSNLMCPSSFLADIKTGETRQYMPESERDNWSGVLSPDGGTVAFLSIPSNGGGNVEIYTVSLEGGEPTSVPVVANRDVFVDITALPNSDLAITPGLGDVYCFLLDWK